MAWTAEELATLRAAYIARLSGQTAQRVRFADREVELDTIDALKEALAEAEADVAAQTHGSTTRYAAYDSGLRP